MALRDAPSSARALCAEMIDISAALGQLQQFMNGVETASLEARRFILLEHVVVTLTASVTTYADLETIIDSVGIENMGVFNKIMWLRKEKDIDDIVQRLQNQKASLTLMVGILNRYVNP
jgi:hypothetical protein